MKRSGTTTVFVIACIAVLIGAYLAGICIRGVRFRQAGVGSEPTDVVENTAAETVSARSDVEPISPPESGEPAAEEPEGFGGDRAGMRERFAGMSDEERQAAMARMRERFGGRQREGGPQAPQLSDEDREKMRAEMDELRSRWEEMSEEERQEATAQMREKYGFAPRIGGPGGGRRPGGRPDGMRQENN